jgi:putative aldouronate transport system permease protein
VAGQKSRISYQKKNALDVLIYSALILFGLMILYPFYNTILVSLVSEKEYMTTPFMLYPKHPTLLSYRYVFASGDILNGYVSTIIVVVFGVAYNMFLTSTSAYALTKDFPGKKTIMVLIIFTMYFGGGLIPYYLLVKNLGLIDTYGAMILPYGVNTFYMLVMRNYFKSIPSEIEESAKIDGANDIRILWQIILPVSLPVIATFLLFFAVDRWGEWFNGVLFIQTTSKRPLQMVLRSILMSLNNEAAVNMPPELRKNLYGDSVKMACVVVVMTPIMFVYPFVQKYFMKGIMIGAVKA